MLNSSSTTRGDEEADRRAGAVAQPHGQRHVAADDGQRCRRGDHHEDDTDGAEAAAEALRRSVVWRSRSSVLLVANGGLESRAPAGAGRGRRRARSCRCGRCSVVAATMALTIASSVASIVRSNSRVISCGATIFSAISGCAACGILVPRVRRDAAVAGGEREHQVTAVLLAGSADPGDTRGRRAARAGCTGVAAAARRCRR